MRPLTFEEYKLILEFIDRHHRFGHVRMEDRLLVGVERFHLNIKYIDVCYDTRCRGIWSISFRNGGMHVRFTSNHFNSIHPAGANWKYTSLYEWVMDFLKGECTYAEDVRFKDNLKCL